MKLKLKNQNNLQTDEQTEQFNPYQLIKYKKNQEKMNINVLS